MDRQSGAEVGGPYSSRDDAERAVASGSFDGNKADLTIREGEDDGGDSSKEAVRKHAFGAAGQPVTDMTPMGANPIAPLLPQPVPDNALPQTTKPSQVPSGGPAFSPGGGLPQDPASAQFNSPADFAPDSPSNNGDMLSDSQAGPDAVSKDISSVAARVLSANPSLGEEGARRIARKVVGQVLAFSAPTVHIEDPLADQSPFEVGKDIADPDGEQQRREQRQQQNQPPAPGRHRRTPGGGGPPVAAGEGLAAGAGEGAAAAGAGEGLGLAGLATELLPLVMI